MPNDPFAQIPVSRPGGGKPARPTISPVSTAMRRPAVSTAKGAEKETEARNPRLERLQLVSVEHIRGSHYQHRDTLNVAEDRDYQQLLAQVSADLEKQVDQEHRTIEHVFLVMPDPDDEEQFILAKGGHRRYQVCLDLGVKEIYVWVKEFNQEELAIGTYGENKGRRKTNWLEDARTYQDIMETLGWNQSQVATYLHVEGGQPHISRCLSMLDYHPDLQRMLVSAEDRGMRAAKELFQLEKHFGIEKAREL